jgi:type III secretion system YscD/HrpQ family protein
MSEPQSFERTVLKILNGVQAGAEVVLTPGEYSIGSGSDDDIQLMDLSLRPGQAKLRITAGKIEIAGGSGGIAIGDELKIGGDSDWHDVEPLDIITAGMIRFVLGPPNANWTTLTQDDAPPSGEALKGRRAYFGLLFPSIRKPAGKFGQLALPAAVLVAVILVGVWYLPFGNREAPVPRVAEADAEKVAREALDQFPFGRQVSLKRQVDGTIYASGFVKDGFERRALAAAVEKSGVQVYLRLGVLEALRNEIDGLIKSEKVPVTYSLSSSGDLALEGLILDEGAAQNFVDRIKGAVAGLNQVESRIRTAKTLLDEVQKVSRTAQIEQFVLLRLDGELIEANGILPIDKIDSWVGFLTSYSRRFSKDIGLRSFVQLQKPDGTLVATPVQPVTIGPQAEGDGALDRDKLLQGRYKTKDLFASASPQASQQVAAAVAPPTLTLAAPTAQSELAPSRDFSNMVRLTQRANELVLGWRTNPSDAQLAKDFDFLIKQRAAIQPRDGNGDGGAEKYLPLLATNPFRESAAACRPGSRLTVDNLPTAIFWLDLLSISSTYSLVSFELEEQGFLLEAALDPKLAMDCLVRSGGNTTVSSLYLTEAPRNPDFIRFLLRDFRPYALDISGASITGPRYVQIRNGEKMREGGAPDSASRLAMVGELGSIVQQKNGYFSIIYAQQLNWLNLK